MFPAMRRKAVQRATYSAGCTHLSLSALQVGLLASGCLLTERLGLVWVLPCPLELECLHLMKGNTAVLDFLVPPTVLQWVVHEACALTFVGKP